MAQNLADSQCKWHGFEEQQCSYWAVVILPQELEINHQGCISLPQQMGSMFGPCPSDLAQWVKEWVYESIPLEGTCSMNRYPTHAETSANYLLLFLFTGIF